MRCQTFAAEADDVRVARSLVADALFLQGFPDESCLDAALLTSELVTNAVVHAGTVFEVAMTIDNGRVLVAVVDRSTRLPQPTPVATDATTGRGLGLVDAIASAWGAELTADGKIVWFELAAAS